MPCTGPSLGWDLSTHRAHGPRGPGGETEAQRGEGRAEDRAVSQSCPRGLPVLFSFSCPECSLCPLGGKVAPARERTHTLRQAPGSSASAGL